MKAELDVDVLCVSDMCVDLLLTGDVRPRFHQVEQIVADYKMELGGSANIFASQFVKLGGTAALIGWAGLDAFGDFACQKLHELSVNTSWIRRHPHLKTGLGVALAEPDDRAILTYLGTIDGLAPDDLRPEFLSSGRHWHLASYFLLRQLRHHWPHWLHACKEAGLTTSLDPNWDPDNHWQGIRELLPLIDVFLPNEAEATAIAGEPSVERAGRKLAALGPLVVIKCGRKGAMAFRGGEQWTAGPASIADAIPLVDAIGAGDNFDAGFLRAWLLGRDIPCCLELACRCGAASLAAAGGIEAQLQENFS